MKRYSLLLIVFILLFTTLFPTSSGVAFADGETSGSNVLDDLSVDESFSVDNYPVNNSNYTLDLFQIAESSDNELLVYVYQPCVQKDFHACAISMSLTITNFDSNIQPHIYYLEYLNSEGTLYKYKVNNFTVSSDSVRYYEIYSIYRPYDSGVDPAATVSSQVINCRAFDVGKRYTCGMVNGNYTISCKEVTTVDITDMFVGFVRYENSPEWAYLPSNPDNDPVDSHLVAFSTRQSIDKVLEATVFYKSQNYYWHRDYYNDGMFDPSEPEDHYAELEYSQTASFTSSGWRNYGTYTWGRIETVDDFIDNENHSNVYNCGAFNVKAYSVLTEQAISDLHNYQYVLRFTETPYRQFRNVEGMYSERRVIISYVSILRLKYIYDGMTYDVGVVSNMQTGSDEPLNTSDVTVELSDDFAYFLQVLMMIVGVLVVLVVLYLLSPIIKIIFKIIFSPFKWLFGSSKSRRKRR